MKSTLVLILTCCFYSVFGQVTTSGISGLIRGTDNEPLIGATVRLIHVPSGTVYGTVADDNGRYNVVNARPGGPYNIEVSSVGSETFKASDLYLSLGDVLIYHVKMADATADLSEIVITAGKNAVFNSDRTGASTNINNATMQRLPTLNRSITDFTRLTPQANGNSFGGRDGRYNNLQIDGASLNNAFGLSSDPLPGGGNQPISLDAIEEIQVNIAPYDVRQTGFTGAGINAITRGGTNEIHGSVYGYYRPEGLTGLNVGDFKLSENSRATTSIVGARVSGPIIKNKLLYFVNLEYENRETSGNNWVAQNESNQGQPNVTRVLESDLIRVSDYLKSKYGYDPGRYQNYANTYNNSNFKALARLDWNINDKNTFTLRYSLMQGTNDQGANNNSGPNPRSSASRISDKSITFENGNYAFSNNVNSLAAELNSRLTSKLSNQFIATYSRIQDTRSTPGSLFPFVDIGDGGDVFTNYMSFGTELFSYNNEVINNNIIVTDNLTYITGNHNITGGLSYQYMDFANSYQRMGTSYYRFKSVDDFVSGAAPISYGTTYLYEGQDNYARVKFGLAGIYLQDKISLGDRFNVTAGIRADMAIFQDAPPSNPVVDTIQFLSPEGAPTMYTTAKWPKSVPLISPRVGFNWDVNGDKTLQVRGGTGIFTGNIPFVYFTNMPTNAGVIQNTFEPVSAAVLEKITELNPDPNYWPNQLPGDFPKQPGKGVPGGLALIDPDFKMPQIWRSNLGVDIKIPSTPLVITGDLIYTKDLVSVYQFNVNRKETTKSLEYSDDHRAYWDGAASARYNNLGANVVPLLTNSDKGQSLAATIGVTLNSYKGLNGGIFYNHTRSEDITGNPGSAANSAWSNNYSVNDPNEQLLGYSQFAVPHRVMANLGYRIEYGKMATTVGLYYNGAHSGRFAWTYNGDVNNDGVSLDLLYIPNSASELNFKEIKSGDKTFSAEDQRAAFEAFVSSIPELDEARGGYVKRNSGLMPWVNRFDFKITQDFTLGGKNGAREHRFQIGIDIFNIGNLINSEWGIYQELNGGSNFNYALLRVEDNKSTTPQFSMAVVNGELATTPFRNQNNIASTWAGQLGLRYIF